MRALEEAAGERRLLIGVLLDAVRLVLEGEADPRRRNARDVVEARRWLWSDDVLAPLSFYNVTEYLDLDPERIRAVLEAAVAPRSQ
jgi:hypothetical protein